MPTVLVVGANRGLGLQFALQYLKKGCNVYGTHRKESAHEAKEVGLLLRLCTLTLRGCLLLESGAKTLTLDLGDEKSIQAAAEAFGDQPLDILINCAGRDRLLSSVIGTDLLQRLETKVRNGLMQPPTNSCNDSRSVRSGLF